MGVSVEAYNGLKLKQVGGSLEDLTEEELDNEPFVCFAPPEGQWQADGLQAGTYSYTELFHEMIGSYTYFGHFRKALTELLPPESDDFKELIQGSDTYLLMGPDAVERLADAFASDRGTEIELVFAEASSSDDFYSTYMAFGTCQ